MQEKLNRDTWMHDLEIMEHAHTKVKSLNTNRIGVLALDGTVFSSAECSLHWQ